MKTIISRTTWVAALAALSIGVNAATVDFVNVDPSRIATINYNNQNVSVYVGVYNLVVDGKAMDSFCIDYVDRVVGGQSYSGYKWVSLSGAPESPLGPMGDGKASDIKELWAYAYSPSISQDAAAAMQLAIWEIIGGDGFTLVRNSVSSGVLGLYDGYLTYVAGDKLEANLAALTHNDYQDFVVGVPDGGVTLVLLGMSMGGLAFLARRKES